MPYQPTDEDFDELVAQSRLVIPTFDPLAAALVLYEESGFDPSNPGPLRTRGTKYAVAGLNQMDLGNLAGIGLTRARWLAMTAAQQLPFVFGFWRALAHTFNGGDFPADAGTILALNFLPGAYRACGAKADPDAVIAGKAGPYAAEYAGNLLLDPAKSGVITVNTCRAYLAGIAARPTEKWLAIVDAVHAAGERAGSIEPGSGGSGGGDAGGGIASGGGGSAGPPSGPPLYGARGVLSMLFAIGIAWFAMRGGVARV